MGMDYNRTYYELIVCQFLMYISYKLYIKFYIGLVCFFIYDKSSGNNIVLNDDLGKLFYSLCYDYNSMILKK